MREKPTQQNVVGSQRYVWFWFKVKDERTTQGLWKIKYDTTYYPTQNLTPNLNYLASWAKKNPHFGLAKVGLKKKKH